MKSTQQAILRMFFLATSVTLVGCESGPVSEEASTAEATVKGVVNIDGKAANEGEVTFDASNSKRSVPKRTAPINKDGTFEIKTLVGLNIVKLDGPRTRKNQILQHQQQSIKVENGDNTMTFDAVSK